MEAKRKLKNVDVLFISLVDKGANKKTIIHKSTIEADPVIEKLITFIKTDEEKHRVYGIVYAPDEVDSQGDMMSAEEIEKTMLSFMKNARTNNIDEQHNYRSGPGYVAECWLVEKGADKYFKDEATGTWAVGIQIDDDETWEKIVKGDIGGLSMGGTAEYEEIEKIEPKESLFKRFFGSITKSLSDRVEEKLKSKIVFDIIYAFENAVYEIYSDGFEGDEKEELLSLVDELKSLVESKVQKNDKGEFEMDEAKAKELVNAAVEKAVTPLTEKIDNLESTLTEKDVAIKEVTEKNTELETNLGKANEKIEALEKAHPGKMSNDERIAKEKAEQEEKDASPLKLV